MNIKLNADLKIIELTPKEKDELTNLFIDLWKDEQERKNNPTAPKPLITGESVTITLTKGNY